ncbi:MAG: acyl-CoA dehydrogenase family protein [Pseudomonadota bacterium]
MLNGFGITPEHEAFRAEIVEFCDRQVRPRAAEIDETGEYPREIHAAMAAEGLLKHLIPPHLGGTGIDMLKRAILIEEFARASAAVCMIPQVNELGVTPLNLFGSSEHQEQWLKPFAEGKLFASFGLTEPDAGSDVANMATTARMDGNHWVLDGRKAWICNFRQPGICTVIARTNDKPGAKGLSAFVIPTDAEGLEAVEAEPTMGLRGSPTYMFTMNNVRVPATNMLGQEGQGFAIAMSSLDITRPAVAAQALGIARAAFECAAEYATQRETMGQPIINHQAIGQMIADMDMKVRAARHLVYEANVALDQGADDCSHRASVAKCYAADIAMQVATDAVQVLGGNGYSKNYPAERYFRDAKVTQIYEGANQIQRLIISRSIARTYAV